MSESTLDALLKTTKELAAFLLTFFGVLDPDEPPLLSCGVDRPELLLRKKAFCDSTLMKLRNVPFEFDTGACPDSLALGGEAATCDVRRGRVRVSDVLPLCNVVARGLNEFMGDLATFSPFSLPEDTRGIARPRKASPFPEDTFGIAWEGICLPDDTRGTAWEGIVDDTPDLPSDEALPKLLP
mmetsp:Transcript_5914/g.14397  ORF Transcript_5914/g.14397 Transcript_5914/m.14397 type:complete len:183 (+) Transcript_5914:123-671(+)